MGRAAPLGGRAPRRADGQDTTHKLPLHRPARGRGGALKRLTQQRGGGEGSWLQVGVRACLQVRKSSVPRRALETASRAGPRAWAPHCSKHEGEPRTFMPACNARVLPFFFC